MKYTERSMMAAGAAMIAAIIALAFLWHLCKMLFVWGEQH
jgi:hypothetical protein